MLKNQIVLILAVALLIVFAAACERTVTNTVVESTAVDCFSCHSDQNTKLVAVELQWRNSIHASGHNIDRNYVLYGTPCNGCHTSEAFVLRVEGQAVPPVVDNPTAIHCFTCHAPHTTGTLELRVTAEQTLRDGTVADMKQGNICSSCHQALQNVNTYVADPSELSEHWGPHHGPQVDMLFATNGYEYAGYDYGDLTFHRTLTAPDETQNDGCLECHMKFTKKNVVGGHAFDMEAEVDGEEVLNQEACSNCHGIDFEELDLGFNYNDVQDDTEMLLDSLAVILETAGLLDAEHHPLEVTTSADSAGAVWNYLIVHEDRSEGVHNSTYILDLLKSAIQYMEGNLPQSSARMNTPVAARKPETTVSKQ